MIRIWWIWISHNQPKRLQNVTLVPQRLHWLSYVNFLRLSPSYPIQYGNTFALFPVDRLVCKSIRLVLRRYGICFCFQDFDIYIRWACKFRIILIFAYNKYKMKVYLKLAFVQGYQPNTIEKRMHCNYARTVAPCVLC